MSNVKQNLLEIFSPDELNDMIENKMNEGARTEHSAMNKILKENNERVVKTDNHKGYYLTSYVGGIGDTQNILLANPSGVEKISGDQIDTTPLERWDAVTVENVAHKTKLTSDSSWLSATDDTVIKKMDSYPVPTSDVIISPKGIVGGGLYLVKGRVKYVNRIPTEFDENNQPVGYEPIIDDEGVNLKLSIVDGNGHTARVTLNSKEQLREVFGFDDISWVNEDPDEVVDLIRNQTIVALGGGDNTLDSGKMVTPFIQLRNFGFVERWD